VPDAPAPPKVGKSTGAKILLYGGIALMVIGLAGYIGDWAARNYELSQLLSQIETSEQAMTSAKDEIAAVTEALPEDPTDEQRDAATEKIEEIAQQNSALVAATGAQVAETSFLPWHNEMLRAQTAYFAHNGAWVSYLDKGASDAATLFNDDNNIEPTWEAAKIAVPAAVPLGAWPTIQARVDSIFSDDEQPENPDAPPGLTA